MSRLDGAGDPHLTAPAAAAGPRSPVRLVLGALAFGVVLGTGLQGLVTWTVRTLQLHTPPAPQPSLGSAPALVLLAGALLSIVAAGIAAWMLLGPIRNPWRQAMLAIIAGLGSFVLSLVTLPLDRAFGRPGLLGLAGAAAVGCLLIAGRLPREAAATGAAE